RPPQERQGHIPEWIRISGSLAAITTGSRTNVWGVELQRRHIQVLRNNAGDPSPSVPIPGEAVDICAAADGTVWHVSSAGDIYRYAGDQPG
ncbi:tectonin domain-containing protein, partial [Streptomyces marokkonensis]|uniref:tectonin domain-containing protein n=1 Tax=Streptomyces marokkonensis TaxID=324855 RepID=UPI0031E72294